MGQLGVSGSGLIHYTDIQYVIDCVTSAKCCAIVGLSNMGKSRLLRTLVSPEATTHLLDELADGLLIVYIDFNLMLDVSEQGFYELILRSILAALELEAVPDDLIQHVRQAYEGIIASASPFAVSLSFIEGIMTASTGLKRRLVLLCDEFDEPFSGLEARVFLNLRALKDRYPEDICYVTATAQRLRDMRREHGAAEFAELFAHNMRFLHPLGRTDAMNFIRDIIGEGDITLTPEEIDFIWDQAGGHLGLLEIASRALVRAQRKELENMKGPQLARRMQEVLDNNLNVRTECAKLWNDLSEPEHQTLTRFVAGDVPEGNDGPWAALQEKGILIRAQGGKWCVFGRLFQDFAHRQGMIQRKSARGVRIDVESGAVWVDGKSAPELTSLEYRLLLLLYGNLNSTCDKYKIVEAVWSEDYLDAVDDARVEKLISRLRQKIEPTPNEPRYLTTVRGRGYKLISPTSENFS
jgi:hypothetical protein